MSATYRCCCDIPCGSCCSLWCECPATITISTCTFIRERTLYACGNGTGTACWSLLPDGEIVGSAVCTVKLTNVKFEKHTCTSGSETKCEYRLVTGAQQTGLLEYSVDANYKLCYDSRLNDETNECECQWFDDVCLGNATVPLDGSVDWVEEMCGKLTFGSCACAGSEYPCSPNPAGDCGPCTCRPSLRLYIQGAKTNGLTKVLCCPGYGGTITLDFPFTTEFVATWQCQHFTRWQGTCPSDLNDLDVECTWILPPCDCSEMPTTGDNFPCSTGQGSDYVTCAVQGIDSCDSSPAIRYGMEYEERYSTGCSRCVTVS